MILLDTSFIVSLLNSRDVHHKKAVEILERSPEDETLGTHSLVVQETISVIARKSREQTFDCREWLTKIEEFFESLRVLDLAPTTRDVLKIIADSDCELSYVDSVLVLANRHLRAPILTFDNALQRMCNSWRMHKEG